MQTIILYIGRNPEINPVMLRLLNAHEGWTGFVADSPESAHQLFQEHRVDVVLLGNGLSKAEEQALRVAFTTQQPTISIVEHYGGGSGLLENEIRQALDTKARTVL
jgi:hypothetical protein